MSEAEKDPRPRPRPGRPPIDIEILERFLLELSVCGSITRAAKLAGVSRTTIYHYMNAFPEFEVEVRRAQDIGADGLEDEARRRAFDGWDEPVHHLGVATSMVRKYSDTLLIFLLKGVKPDRYKERRELSGGVKTTPDLDLSGLNDHELDLFGRLLDKAKAASGGRSDTRS